jgi:5'(3')-deoxyribonucleotidase
MFGFKLIVGLIIRHRGFDQHVFLTDKGRWLAGKMPFIQKHNLLPLGKSSGSGTTFWVT